jgi:Fe2+ or Zn2+ uptake regulation protein
MKKEAGFDPTKILRQAGYRATQGRIKLLKVLVKENKPLTAVQIHRKVGSKELNEATIYRALETMVSSGIIRRVDLQKDNAHRYELAGGQHHHHIVCSECGAVENFSDNLCRIILDKAAKKSKSFKIINSHSMELFGVCAYCSKIK